MSFDPLPGDCVKNFVRWILIGIAMILVSPIALPAMLERWLGAGQELFTLGAHLVALAPGRPGVILRTAYYILTLDAFDPTAMIGFGSFFSQRGARVGRRAGTGQYCVIGMVDLGPGVRLASRVSITSGLHQHGSSVALDAPETRSVNLVRVRIGENAWIGEGATVGCDVGANSVVGIGAVVTKPVPDGALAMGNPARLLPKP